MLQGHDRRSLWSSVKQRVHRDPGFSCLAILYKIIPFLDWFPKYNWRHDFINDCMAGFTVAVLHVPQGMGLMELRLRIIRSLC